MILREHTARTLDHPKPDWAVNTPPSADKVDLLARDRVQADHEARIQAISTDQTDQYQDLRQVCRARENAPAQTRDLQRDGPKEAFNRTNQVSPQETKTRLSTRERSGPTRT